MVLWGMALAVCAGAGLGVWLLQQFVTFASLYAFFWWHRTRKMKHHWLVFAAVFLLWAGCLKIGKLLTF